MRLFCDSILIRPDRVAVPETGAGFVVICAWVEDVVGWGQSQCGWICGIDCWHHGGEVLELVEVLVRRGFRLREGIFEKWVVRSEGKMVDDMAEVEF